MFPVALYAQPTTAGPDNPPNCPSAEIRAIPIAAPRASRNTGGTVQNTMNTAYPEDAAIATSTAVAHRFPAASGKAKYAALASNPVTSMCHFRSPARSELRHTNSTTAAANTQTKARMLPASVTDFAPAPRSRVGNQIWFVFRNAMVKYTTTISQTLGLRTVSMMVLDAAVVRARRSASMSSMTTCFSAADKNRALAGLSVSTNIAAIPSRMAGSPSTRNSQRQPRRPSKPSIPSMIPPEMAPPTIPDNGIPTRNRLVARPRRWSGNQKLRYSSTPGKNPASNDPSKKRWT